MKFGMEVYFCHECQLLKFEQNLDGDNSVIGGLPSNNTPWRFPENGEAFVGVVGCRNDLEY